MRVLISFLAYLLALALVAAVVFVLVITVAGPHSGLLPGWLEVVVACLGWAAVVVLPVLAARATWRRLGRR